jgi:hypothetical protein
MEYERFTEICSIFVKLGIFEYENGSIILVIKKEQIRMSWHGSRKYYDINGSFQCSGEKISIEEILEIVDDDIKEKIIFNLDLFLELEKG